MKTKTIEVATCPDWDLVLATNWTALQHDLKPEVEEEVLVAVWEKQDGYGVPGFNPPKLGFLRHPRQHAPSQEEHGESRPPRPEEARHRLGHGVVGRDDGTVRVTIGTGTAISHNRQNTKFKSGSEVVMVVETQQNPLSCGSQKAKAKSRKGQIVGRIARFVRKEGLSYDDWRYVARQVRRKCDLHPGKKPKKLPRVLTADQFRAFYRAWTKPTTCSTP